MCMAALLLLAASCKKEKKVETGEGIGFRATTEAPSGTGKTYLDGTLVKWKHDDAILVCSGSEPEGRKFIANVIGDDERTADFDADGLCPEEFFEPQYTAFYPYNNVTAAEGVYTLSLPATQVYAEGGFAPGAFPMMAVSNNTKLTFKNICGMLELKLYNPSQTTPCKVRNITITSLKDGEMLWGEGTAVMGLDANPVLSDLANGSGSLKLDCFATGQGVELSIDEANPTVFHFVVPAGTLSAGFTVKVTDVNGDIWTKNATQDNSIVRNTVTMMPTQPVSCTISYPVGSVEGGVFTVGLVGGFPKRVFFSNGNLQYQASTGTWRFAESQYTYIGNAPGNNTTSGRDTQVHWIDLFGWGTSGVNPNADGEVDPYYVNYQPWATSTATVNGTYNKYGYGPSVNRNPMNADGENERNLLVSNGSDWGCNAIENGGNARNFGWRTLNSNEVLYLFNTRKVQGKTGYGNTCVWATLDNGISGLIIFCDDYEGSTTGLTTIPDGCAFLPVTGRRVGSSVSNLTVGFYWNSSLYGTSAVNSGYACNSFFYSGNFTPYASGNLHRYFGRAVRLVYDK